MGGPDANTDRLKQSISAVRASGGFHGNVVDILWCVCVLVVVLIESGPLVSLWMTVLHVLLFSLLGWFKHFQFSGQFMKYPWRRIWHGIEHWCWVSQYLLCLLLSSDCFRCHLAFFHIWRWTPGFFHHYIWDQRAKQDKTRQDKITCWR